MGVLKVKVNGVWQEVSGQSQEPPMDEVWVGTTPPDPTVFTYELWVDTSSVPAVPKYKDNSGAWREIAGSEVHIGVEDPYVLNPDSRAELWHDISIGGQGGKLKARYGNSWHPVAEFTESEVEIGGTDPTTIPGIPAGSTELWVNTAVTPVVMNAWVNGQWEAVGGANMPAAPQEVEIGPVDPRDATTELWYDTTNSPKGTLFANNMGVWEPIGGADEVEVGDLDPYTVDAAAATQLWFAPITQTLRARVANAWVPVESNEVYVGGLAPPQGNDAELWFNTASVDPNVPLGDGAVLLAKVGGNWVSAVPNEFHVSSGQPTDPNVELWYDVDAVATTSALASENAGLRQRIEQLEVWAQRQGWATGG